MRRSAHPVSFVLMGALLLACGNEGDALFSDGDGGVGGDGGQGGDASTSTDTDTMMSTGSGTETGTATSTSTNSGTGTSSGTSSGTGTSTGTGTSVGSCSGSCGALAGTCYCDAQCFGNNDCCPDVCGACPNTPGCLGTGTGSGTGTGGCSGVVCGGTCCVDPFMTYPSCCPTTGGCGLDLGMGTCLPLQ